MGRLFHDRPLRVPLWPRLLGEGLGLTKEGLKPGQAPARLHVSLLLSPLPPEKRTGKVSALEARLPAERPLPLPAPALTPLTELPFAGEQASPHTLREFQTRITETTV